MSLPDPRLQKKAHKQVWCAASIDEPHRVMAPLLRCVQQQAVG